MTMMMMQRLIETSQKPRESGKSPTFVQQKRISDDSRDVEMCQKTAESDEEDLNVDVENDDGLCPVDLTRRQEKFANSKPDGDFKDFKSSFKLLKQDEDKTSSAGDYSHVSGADRSESVCSDVSRSDSPRIASPSAVTHHVNRRLAFSVENILDPNKFTGRQVYSDGVCCWKPHQENLGSPDFDGGSETGEDQFKILPMLMYLYSYMHNRLHLFLLRV